MITIEQCRAARGLLAWTQQDLAEASGLSKTAINNFEKGHSDIKADSLRAIRLAFESSGVGFIGHEGVKKKKDNAEILTGSLIFEELLDDIIQTLKTTGGEVNILNTEGRLSTLTGEHKINAYNEALKKLNICEKTINNENSPYDWGCDDQTRTLPAKTINTAHSFIVYGPKAAIFLWDLGQIITLNSTQASDAEKRRFEKLWEIAESRDLEILTRAKKTGN